MPPTLTADPSRKWFTVRCAAGRHENTVRGERAGKNELRALVAYGCRPCRLAAEALAELPPA